MKSPILANAIAKHALSKKALDVVILDLRPVTSMTDFFVVCSAESETQLKAISDAVLEGTGEKGEFPWHKETGSPNWIVLDYSDVVLHIFHKTSRGFYNLEKLWGDAKMKHVTDKKPSASARNRKTTKKKATKAKSLVKKKTPAGRKRVAG